MNRVIAVIVLSIGALTAAAAGPIDQVIFKDGFSITGRRYKEQEMITDRQNGTSVVVPKARGFDIIETGPKWIIFSNKTQQVGKLLENVRGENEFKMYDRPVIFKGKHPLPANGLVKIGEWNDKWIRIIRVDIPINKSFAEIEQRVHSVSPTRIVMPSANYLWYPFHDTREFDPQLIRKMIATHPDNNQENGPPDADKRLDIAQFMKDAGWFDVALKEIDKARIDVPGVWAKEVNERAEKLTAEIQKAKTARLTVELEKAVKSGRYQTAGELINLFDEKTADSSDAKLFATMKAQVEIVEPRFAKGRKLLRATLDRLTGGTPSESIGALGGGYALGSRAPVLTPEQTTLLAAGEQVLAEIHPDTVERIDFFLSLAEQAERRILNGEDPGTTPEKLIALAMTGWIKGRNGAEQNVDTAIRYWKWRDMLLAYQVEPTINNRRELYANLIAGGAPLPPEEIAQIIGYLPPPEPENLEKRFGVQVQPGIYRRNTGPLRETANGVDYVVRLPSEYHHGRPARLILALTHHSLPADEMIRYLGAEADRHGCIVVAPQWVNEWDQAYDWSGDQHYMARGVLRDALKHFRIDNDRVFLFGYNEGANFAMDLGASHPDLFAGVVAMAPNPKHFNMFMHYWRNMQKLPLYACIGSIAGDSFSNLRRCFEDWMPKGYPAIGVIYRGRAAEWFAGEVPTMFDWMSPKKRVNGTAVLRLNEPVEPWISMRDADDRFYWVGSDKLDKYSTLEQRGGKSFTPAEISADIRQGNHIVLRTRGTQNVIIWLDRNMIDWSKPIRVSINGTVPNGYRAKVLKPDIELMLEQLYKTGDRSLLFLNRLEFPTVR